MLIDLDFSNGWMNIIRYEATLTRWDEFERIKYIKAWCAPEQFLCRGREYKLQISYIPLCLVIEEELAKHPKNFSKNVGSDSVGDVHACVLDALNDGVE